MAMAERKIVKDFDKDGDKRLNDEERAAAREVVKKQNAERPRGGFGGPPGAFPPPPDGVQPPGLPGQPSQPGQAGPGGPQGPGGTGGRRGGFGPMANLPPATKGVRLTPAEVKEQTMRSLYATNALHTFFFTFSNKDWEAELSDFHNTDVDVPAKLTVGDEAFDEVGLHFRGMSSYMMVPQGRKHSLNVALDHADKKARLDGYKTLNLLNSNGDASMMSTVLYSQIARAYIPAPKANFVRVAINGENWGVYTNVQQFNKDFLQENYRTEKGARWKVKGSPGGGGGLEYIGDKVEDYKRRYDLKTDEDVDDWKALIELCRVLKETPADQLEAKLRPIADVDNLLWFLALDCALINSDGYWVRASDYSIYRDKAGKFHFIPHDMNESFTIPHMMGGPQMGGRRDRRDGPGNAPFPGGPQPGPGNPPPLEAGGATGTPPPPQGAPMAPRIEIKGVELDPLIGMDDTSKPLRSKVLAVPTLRKRYLENVRTIAEEWLDWKKLGPIVAEYRALLEPEVAKETRSLTTVEAFRKATADQPAAAEGGPEGRRRELSLREFADQRRAYLLAYPAIRDLAR